MYSRPSSSIKRAPRPSRKNTGVPPTARNARTGEFTPPGMSLCERSKSARLRSYMLVSGCGRSEQASERLRGRAHLGGAEERGDHRHHVRARGDRAADGDVVCTRLGGPGREARIVVARDADDCVAKRRARAAHVEIAAAQ